MTNADKFKQVFGLYATELWAKTEKEFLEWLNADCDVPDNNVGNILCSGCKYEYLHCTGYPCSECVRG